MSDLTCHLWGMMLRNPVLVAPSPPTAYVEGILNAEKEGAGAVITKSVGPHSESALPEDRRQVKYIPGFGMWMQSTYRREILTLRQGAELVRSAKRRAGIPIIASVFCPSLVADQWVKVASALAEAGADAIHLDLFYLPLEPPAESAAEQLRALVSGVCGAVSLPVVVKLNIHLDLVTVVRTCIEAGARGFAYLDSARLGSPLSPSSPVTYLLPGQPSSMCALAGQWIRPLTMAFTDRLRKLTTCQLCAGGGLFTGRDAMEALVRGADAVQLCTAVLVNGWQVVREVEKGIADGLSQLGLGSLSELKGIHSPISVEPVRQVARVALDKCRGCHKCSSLLICRALSFRDGHGEVDVQQCEGCGLCAELCPNEAIALA
jgi:dihydropyrimidine dehydrogenase (NAD+) subunit PreA